ncbi:carboxymuconolactone decarboxylase family protein [Mycobacterium sp. NPDC003449]
MTYFVAVEPDAASGKAADLLAQVQKTLGSTPNMTKVMANSPALLKSYLALFSAVATGSIPAAVRARLAIATAQLNGCEYCLSSHTYIGANITKVEAAELERARSGESEDPHVDALLTLSNLIVENAGDVDEADIIAAGRAGVTEEEIGELIANLSLNIMTNYFNVMARVENDWPVVSL